MGIALSSFILFTPGKTIPFFSNKDLQLLHNKGLLFFRFTFISKSGIDQEKN